MQEAQSTQGHEHEHRSDIVILPAPTPWPMVLALGLSLMITGMVTHWVISLLGLILTLRAIFGWFFDIFPHELHVAVPVQTGVMKIASSCRSPQSIARFYRSKPSASSPASRAVSSAASQ